MREGSATDATGLSRNGTTLERNAEMNMAVVTTTQMVWSDLTRVQRIVLHNLANQPDRTTKGTLLENTVAETLFTEDGLLHRETRDAINAIASRWHEELLTEVRQELYKGART